MAPTMNKSKTTIVLEWDHMFETYTKHETFVETWMAKWQKFWFLSLSESDRSQCSATHLASSFTSEVHLLTQKKGTAGEKNVSTSHKRSILSTYLGRYDNLTPETSWNSANWCNIGFQMMQHKPTQRNMRSKKKLELWSYLNIDIIIIYHDMIWLSKILTLI